MSDDTTTYKVSVLDRFKSTENELWKGTAASTEAALLNALGLPPRPKRGRGRPRIFIAPDEFVAISRKEDGRYNTEAVVQAGSEGWKI